MIELGVDALAAYRLTRLVTTDTVLDRPRAYLIRRAYEHRDGRDTEYENPPWWNARAIDDDDPPMLAELITCRFCTGVWISGFVVAARRYAPVVWDPIARALATAAAAALVGRLEADV